jgi:hypothetical protein
MQENEYIIFSDESVKQGEFYSNFYGGVIVKSSEYQQINRRFNEIKENLGFHSEVKWSKVTDQYLERYMTLIDAYFDEIAEKHLRVRIMFTHNAHTPSNLTPEDHDLGYFKLYYQFIKHALLA